MSAFPNESSSVERYSRQVSFKPIGPEGQKRLSRKHVLIVGAGALGSAGAESLARAGVGKLTIVDRDYVEWSNLQRQQLYTEEDVLKRTPKAVAAMEHLAQINSRIEVRALVMDAKAEELEKLAKQGDLDLIVDACDNFDTRFIINDISGKYRIPWIYGACASSYGICYTIIPGSTPCLSCMLDIIPSEGESCDLEGIIAPAVQMVVANQTAEALKILTGNAAELRNKLLSFDVWNNQYTTIDVSRMQKPHCPSCGVKATYPYLSRSFSDSGEKAAVLCGRNTVHIRPSAPLCILLSDLRERLGGNNRYHDIQIEAANSFLLSLTKGELRCVIFADGRGLIHGTSDVALAKQFYQQLIAVAQNC